MRYKLSFISLLILLLFNNFNYAQEISFKSSGKNIKTLNIEQLSKISKPKMPAFKIDYKDYTDIVDNII